MIPFFVLVLLVHSFSFDHVLSQICSQIRVLRNILSYSEAEINNLISAFDALYDAKVIEEFARIHSENFDLIHNNPQFLSWHRYFVYNFENRLRQINPSLTIPYWVSCQVECVTSLSFS